MSATDELNLDSTGFPTERYEPIRLLGKGSLGEVYLAKDKMLGRTVAVKCLLTVSDEQVVLFHREAKIASKLNHAHVIGSLDFGTTEGGKPYLALEYFDGVSLEKLLEDRGPLPEELVTEIFLIVAEALNYIHSHKIFHRDLKPSNILLKIDDTGSSIDVRIIDFGLSSIKEEYQTKTLMQGRTIVGTPLYMSPDQVNGGVYDARSEVYSLACLMFEALTGQPPFSGTAALEVLEHHANTQPPLLADVRPDLNFSDGMQLVLTECLAKSKEDRFQSMESLVDALQHKNSLNFGDESRDQKKKLRSQWAVIGSLTLLLLFLGTAAIIYYVVVEPTEETQVKERDVTQTSALALLVDPITVLNQKMRNDNGFYIWGQENLDRLKQASENGARLDAITLRGLTITPQVITSLQPLRPKLLYFRDCQFDSDEPLKQLAKIGSIERLAFFSCKGIRPQFLVSLKVLVRLRTLLLNNSEIGDEHMKSLSELTQVKQFVLNGNEAITIDGIMTMSRDDQTVVIWVDAGPTSRLSLDQTERLKKGHKIVLLTKKDIKRSTSHSDDD